MSKSLFASKTFWVNAIAALVALLSSLSGSELIAGNPQLAQAFVLIVSLLNVYLRWLTDSPVHLARSSRS